MSREIGRTQFVRYIVKIGEKGRNHTVSTDTSVNTAFTDASSIAPWAKDAVAFCQTNKLMNGDNHGAFNLMNGDNHGAFNPKGQIKSVELAQVLYNLSQQIK